MGDRVLLAKRINNGQSEVWLGTETEKRRVVATNGIVYPVRTLCSPEESIAFHAAFALGQALVPLGIMDRLIVQLELDA